MNDFSLLSAECSECNLAQILPEEMYGQVLDIEDHEAIENYLNSLN